MELTDELLYPQLARSAPQAGCRFRWYIDGSDGTPALVGVHGSACFEQQSVSYEKDRTAVLSTKAVAGGWVRVSTLSESSRIE